MINVQQDKLHEAGYVNHVMEQAIWSIILSNVRKGVGQETDFQDGSKCQFRADVSSGFET